MRSARLRPHKAIWQSKGSSNARKATQPIAFIPVTASFPKMPNSPRPARDAGIVFVGPPVDAIRAMGLKDRAKALMEKAGVPVVPGYHGEMPGAEISQAEGLRDRLSGADQGGRRRRRQGHAARRYAMPTSMRRWKARSAKRNASFGDGRVLIEKYVAAPRHIELQVFADAHGNAIHLNERDCSLQRRHQKGDRGGAGAGHERGIARHDGRGRCRGGAGGRLCRRRHGRVHRRRLERVCKPGGYWFMEMNTRLQVEHPVTEADHRARSGRMAVPHRLRRKAAADTATGAVARSCGRGADLRRGSGARFPALDRHGWWRCNFQTDGVRVDTGVEAGGEITPYYDPMIAKMIAHGPTRGEALDRLAAALDETIVAGPRTNLGVAGGALPRGRVPQRRIRYRLHRTEPARPRRSAARTRPRRRGASARRNCWRASRPASTTCRSARPTSRLRRGTRPTRSSCPAPDAWPSRLRLKAKPVVAEIIYGRQGPAVSVEGVPPAPDAMAVETADAVYVLRHGRQTVVTLRDAMLDEAGDQDEGGLVRAPMHGKVLGAAGGQG